MTARRARAWLAFILLSAAALRLTAVDWDGYRHYHPDERYISWVATSIEPPPTLAAAFLPHESTFNPYYWPDGVRSAGIVLPNDEPRRFAYGHLPLYLGVWATRLTERLGPILTPYLPPDWLLTSDILNAAGRIEFNHLTAVARTLTALVDVGTVWLVYLLGRRLYTPIVGLLAAAFLAMNVMHIQLAHFFAVDPYVTFFVVAAISCMVYAIPKRDEGRKTNDQGDVRSSLVPGPWSLNVRYALLAGALGGLAVGSKFSAVLLVVPLAITFWLDEARPFRRRALWLLAALLLGVAAFVATNPFAVVDDTCEAITPPVNVAGIHIPALDWQSCFLENLGRQNAMVRGAEPFAFTRQYLGTLPYLYHIEMQLRWGMGPFLGLVAFGGFAWVLWRLLAGLRRPPLSRRSVAAVLRRPSLLLPAPAHFVVLAWCLLFFLTTGNFLVKFMRYLQPLTPFLMIYGAAWMMSWRKSWWRSAAIAVVLLATGAYVLAFVNLYDRPHPWIAASEWIYDHIEPGALILGEQWDDSLPDQVGDERGDQYRMGELTWLTGAGERDNEAKLMANLQQLAQADFVTLASNRIYGVVPRLPADYPLSSHYHQLLFDGRLGYEIVYVGTRTPHLGNFNLKPDTFGWPTLQPPAEVKTYLESLPGLNGGRADESFTVYDQPLVIIFANSGRLTAEEMRRLFP